MSPHPHAAAPHRPRLSDVLSELAETWSQPRISVGQLIQALEDRGLIGLLLILAVANVIPNPPGTSAVLGLPMLYLSWQMMRGGMPWLPQFLAARSFDIDHFRTVVARTTPRLNRVERLLRPRLPSLSSPAAFRILGAVCLLLSVVLAMPIPFGNLLPAAAIAIIALGALERDGLWIAGGVLFGIAVSVFLASAIVIVTRAILSFVGL
ncbi:MAG: exopolysaccharide biosynthesis protein [Alphaproteobacteria bacterium]|nr:exopolysaccharide biosynthesis protein [Alphaproteobacteria bacterium]